MKKTIAIALTAALATACFAGCSQKKVRQTATAYLDQNENSVTATIDLSNGYSCDFARGAVYIYDQENKEGVESVAMVLTLDKDVYEDYVKDSKGDAEARQINGGTLFKTDGSVVFIATAGDKAQYAIVSETLDKAGMEKLITRVEMAPEV